MNIGMHFSIAGGLPQALIRAQLLGCEALQLFVQNPRSWRWRQVTSQEIDRFRQVRERCGINVVAAHLSYLPNLGADDNNLWQRSWERLQAELSLAKDLEIDFLVCHPGHAAVAREGHRRLADGLNAVVQALPPPPLILLENTAGQKNELGQNLAALGEIFSLCQEPVGLCLDSAHAFAAGYNLRQAKHRQRLAQEIATGPGLEALKLIHLNDALYPCGSRRDRHWHLGRGSIGKRGLQHFFSEFARQVAAIILETPKKEPAADASNLAMARTLAAHVLRQTPAEIRLAQGPGDGRR